MRCVIVGEIILAYFNITSVRNKFDGLIHVINGNVDILLIAETKIGVSFPPAQFTLEGYQSP